MTDKPKNLFDNLGKATLRGIRKCPKCGTFNGTRGLSCKNQECKLIFKVPKDKISTDLEVDAVKIVCTSNLQIYSVKLQYVNEYLRCFVHLPIIEGIEALQDESEIAVIKQSAAMCYASTCRKPIDDMCTITLNLNPCSHTHSILSCVLIAEPLVIKRMVVKVMPIPELIKEEIYSLVSKSEEHLVQRISKTTMIIKCNPEDKHPLGFLHFTILEPGKKSKKFKILCECQSEHTKPFYPKEKQMCLHFHLCICAFASDPKLLNEYQTLIQQVLTTNAPVQDDTSSKVIETEKDVIDLRTFLLNDTEVPCKKQKTETHTSNIHENNNANKSNKTCRIIPILTRKKSDIAEPLPSINFEQWLASVTEQINQTMHYQFNGSPEPLVFHVPQTFFDILQHRIATGSKKKRLPNTVVAFSRQDSLPVGLFSKYTWHITNILHVKRIFDTVIVPLEVTRSFIENKDGTYMPYNFKEQETLSLTGSFRKTFNNQLIKPLEMKTFLKVGTMSLDQKEPTPFIIEWIPDILPKTHIGELRITFEYGHQRNGIIEKRDKTQPSRRKWQ